MCAFSPPHWEPMTSYAFDVDPFVVQAVAAKREVLAAKQPDLLGVSRAGWNNSTSPIIQELGRRRRFKRKTSELEQSRKAC